jgi:hypothetical protein
LHGTILLFLSLRGKLEEEGGSLVTESEWLTCTNPVSMLVFLGERASERKLRLFACLAARRHWSILEHPSSRTAIEAGEHWANGQIDDTERAAVAEAATQCRTADLVADFRSGRTYDLLSPEGNRLSALRCATAAATAVLNPDAWTAADLASADSIAASAILARSSALGMGADELSAGELAEAARKAAEVECAGLLRHVIGNPFSPIAVPAACPAAVGQLAIALSHGEPVIFALHDALLDAGHPELAEHFRTTDHPPGCWVLDALLGRT